MQNRYAGDIGDFGKFGLLRYLSRTGLRIGVNWYLTPDETHNGDGSHTAYLRNETYRACDGELFEALGKIVNPPGRRSVASLKEAGILNAVYYDKVLDFRCAPDRAEKRRKWHADALDCLADAEIVFLDPDNGLMVPSAAKTARANKYAELSEIADYCRRPRKTSVIWYQHKARRGDEFYRDQFRDILKMEEFRGMCGMGLKFSPVSQRYYFLLIQPEHREILSLVDNFLETPWKTCFSPFPAE